MGRHWTKQEEQALLQGVGAYGVDWFRDKGGPAHDWDNADTRRSRYAIYKKAQRLFGEGGVTRGSYSLEQLVRMSGYSRSQILRARSALDQKWKRTSSPGGSYLIYEDQADDIMQWLITDYWCKKHRLYSCMWCHSSKIPHRVRGLCRRCYWLYRRALVAAGLPSSGMELLVLVKKAVDDLVMQRARKNLELGRAISREAIGMLGN